MLNLLFWFLNNLSFFISLILDTILYQIITSVYGVFRLHKIGLLISSFFWNISCHFSECLQFFRIQVPIVVLEIVEKLLPRLRVRLDCSHIFLHVAGYKIQAHHISKESLYYEINTSIGSIFLTSFSIVGKKKL